MRAHLPDALALSPLSLRASAELSTIVPPFPRSADPRVAKRLIQDELALDGIPSLNLASFVTTYQEPEAEELMRDSQCLAVPDGGPCPLRTGRVKEADATGLVRRLVPACRPQQKLHRCVSLLTLLGASWPTVQLH